MGEIIINYILICVTCYIIGSIPFAYLVVKKIHDKDVTKEGTGNVGAMNSYDITGSRTTGIIVLILDLLKGMIPVLVLMLVFKLSMSLIILPSILLVAGHNFSVFLKFKGGRGLATALGVMLVINFVTVLIWGLFYMIANKIKPNVHIATVAATILYTVPVIFFSRWINKFSYNPLNEPDSNFLLFTFCASLSILILLKHIEPIQNLILNRNADITKE